MESAKQIIRQLIKRHLHCYRLKKDLEAFCILRDINLEDTKVSLWSQFSNGNKSSIPSIGFIIPGMPKGSGGHTSILRLGSYLAGFGHDVYYISYRPENRESMVMNARFNLNGFKGEICGPEALSSVKIDIGIATYWLSAYYLWNMGNSNYKAYFIQDYEPDFYPAGAVRIFVENTYRMGYHMISLGVWNKKRIEKEIGANVDAIVFPYEPDEYNSAPGWELKFREKNTIKVCAYLKGDEKRGGALLLMGLEELYKVAQTRGIKLEISLFGDDKKLKYPISIPYMNRGKLGKEELRKLYSDSDFGVVFSYTNISLVPLEMMACGCPVVEVSDGSFKDFFEPKCAILVKSFPKDFVSKIMYYIEHPQERKRIAEQALKSLERRTWEEAAEQFRGFLIEGYNDGREPSNS